MNIQELLGMLTTGEAPRGTVRYDRALDNPLYAPEYDNSRLQGLVDSGQASGDYWSQQANSPPPVPEVPYGQQVNPAQDELFRAMMTRWDADAARMQQQNPATAANNAGLNRIANDLRLMNEYDARRPDGGVPSQQMSPQGMASAIAGPQTPQEMAMAIAPPTPDVEWGRHEGYIEGTHPVSTPGTTYYGLDKATGVRGSNESLPVSVQAENASPLDLIEALNRQEINYETDLSDRDRIRIDQWKEYNDRLKEGEQRKEEARDLIHQRGAQRAEARGHRMSGVDPRMASLMSRGGGDDDFNTLAAMWGADTANQIMRTRNRDAALQGDLADRQERTKIAGREATAAEQVATLQTNQYNDAKDVIEIDRKTTGLGDSAGGYATWLTQNPKATPEERATSLANFFEKHIKASGDSRWDEAAIKDFLSKNNQMATDKEVREAIKKLRMEKDIEFNTEGMQDIGLPQLWKWLLGMDQ